MGTYDTRGGGAISPTVDTIAPSALVEAVLGLLEETEIDTATNDRVVALIEAAELRKVQAKTWPAGLRPSRPGDGPDVQHAEGCGYPWYGCVCRAWETSPLG